MDVRGSPGFNKAAKPGFSNNQNGIAFDISIPGGDGNSIYEWLKRNAQMSQGLDKFPYRFEQVLILIILLLQYVIDENNRPSIVQEAPVELLIDYMNPFIRDHIQDYAEHIGVG